MRRILLTRFGGCVQASVTTSGPCRGTEEARSMRKRMYLHATHALNI